MVHDYIDVVVDLLYLLLEKEIITKQEYDQAQTLRQIKELINIKSNLN